MRNIRRLLDERMFGDIRALANRIIADHASWEKARRAGGRKQVQGQIQRLVDKHSATFAMASAAFSGQLGPKGAGLLGMVANPATVSGLVAQLLCGKASGTDEEEAAIRAKIRELDGLIAQLPEYGDESLQNLQDDSALVELLAQVSSIEEALQAGVEPGPISRALEYIGA